MGAFNTVIVDTECMHCGRRAVLTVQFKYGNTWQFEYKVGDELRWGGNEIGERNAKKVVVDGFAEPCPHCGLEGDYEVFIVDNKIDSVDPPARLYNFAAKHKTYIILEE